MELDPNLINWSRAQFAMTAAYHWLFVPLTLGLALVMAIAETVYYRTRDIFWKNTAKFWMKIFGINFAIGVATGLILEFEFGTNWSNYSWFVGDIFGAPLAIEGILAFFMEATFIAVMFFGWDRVSRRFHLASTWLTGLGATISAWWILVANSWMQYPVGMVFNPDTVRNEMADFWAVAFSPVAIVKFFHTVISSWIVGATVVTAIAAWYLLRKGERYRRFAVSSIRISSVTGLAACLITLFTGDLSAWQVAQTQPMKLAAIEGLYEGGDARSLSAAGILNPDKEWYDDGEDEFVFNISIPYALSYLATRDMHGFVPGVKEIIEGGYTMPDGSTAISAKEKIRRGKAAISAMKEYREGNIDAKQILDENIRYFGYGYINDEKELVPDIRLNYYAFRIMVGLGCWFILLYLIITFLTYRNKIHNNKFVLWLCVISVPLAYMSSQAGWIVAEAGRQPWAIQDLMPVNAAISKLSAGSVQLTFIIFAVMFTILLAAELGIMFKAIKKGPEID